MWELIRSLTEHAIRAWCLDLIEHPLFIAHRERPHPLPTRVAHLYSKPVIYMALRTSLATSSMSSALSLVKGRGMSVSEITLSPFTRTSKQPFRGFSSLILICAAGAETCEASDACELVESRVRGCKTDSRKECAAASRKRERRVHHEIHTFSRASSLEARVLKAPQLLHASIAMALTLSAAPFFATGLAFFSAAAAGAASVALRFGAIVSFADNLARLGCAREVSTTLLGKRTDYTVSLSFLWLCA